MMSPEAVVTSLCTAFEEEVDRYTQALRAAEELPAALREGRDPEPHLQDMLRQLHEISRIEQRIVEPKRQWLQARGQPHPQLEALRGRLVGLIRALQELVLGAEKEAALRKHRLAPELDALIRGQQMQRAYGRSSRAEGPS